MAKTKLMADLRRLHDDTEALCKQAAERKESFPKDEVNWADLGCAEAALVIAHNGDERYQVYVCEASPEAADLQQFIFRGLIVRGWDDVEVRTEW